MPDVIHLLSDAVANQIAAGEVIQRPASVVKELMENALDAGATEITVHIKDSGRTLIQIADNGSGMSETDARMAFERHATSKILQASDLFTITTMGFRGEALASIAAVAEVVLRSRQAASELGTEIQIAGSKVQSQEPVACNPGTIIQVKNLFFNTPARRKFLKSDFTEQKYIIQEFQKVAIAFPGVSMVLVHNNTEIYNLPASGSLQRIVRIIGKNAQHQLVEIHTETSIVTINGFIGKPEMARKKFGEQYFFVNKRYIRHHYLHGAVNKAYEHILPTDTIPSYFIFFTIDPKNIDVNIHPTKTEVKFEDEQSVWQILHAAARESLGKFNIVPSLDFNTEASIDFPVFSSKDNSVPSPPEIQINPSFNPFEEEKITRSRYSSSLNKSNLLNWEKLYSDFEQEGTKTDSSATGTSFPELGNTKLNQSRFLQVKGRFIITPVKSGLLIIDQRKAHERILYEKFLGIMEKRQVVAQQDLFPKQVELSPDDYAFLLGLLPQINSLGFDVRDFGNGSVVINGYPAELENPDPEQLLLTFLKYFREESGSLKLAINEKLAGNLARASAIFYGKQLSDQEMNILTDQLFACQNPSFTFDGQTILTIIQEEEIEKRLR